MEECGSAVWTGSWQYVGQNGSDWHRMGFERPGLGKACEGRRDPSQRPEGIAASPAFEGCYQEMERVWQGMLRISDRIGVNCHCK